MKIVVLVKYVPEPTATWSLTPQFTLDRKAVEGRLSELDEYAVEQALKLVEGGADAEIHFLTMGPPEAATALRKALAMGGVGAVHVQDPAIAGSDALGTSLVLSKALEHMGFDLVMAGMASTDAEMSVVPAMVAKRLGVNMATFAGELSLEGGAVRIRRETDAAAEQARAALPAVVTVTDQTGEPRYPAFKAIMAAKKKPVQQLSLADLGISADQVGSAGAAIRVRQCEAAPERPPGTVINLDETSAGQLVEFLSVRGLI